VTQVAHELKSPLNVVSMYSESLLSKEGETEDFRIEASNVIRDEVERLAMLVNTMLNIARIETGAVSVQRQRVRVAEFLEDCCSALSRTVGRANLSLSLDLPKDLSPIYVDKELFRVAINNLLTNAIKYNRDGGEVILSAEETGDRSIIRVRDTGIGIREEDLPHIFEKFYRSGDEEAQSRGGHGLGLPLAREIVQLHGGQLQLETAPDEGSQFSIVLRRRAGSDGQEART
jgi:signal transduction histidine kinase